MCSIYSVTLFHLEVPSHSDILATIPLTWYIKVLNDTSVMYKAVWPSICGPPYRDAFHDV